MRNLTTAPHYIQMSIKMFYLTFSALILMALTGCAGRQAVVLVPDQNGQVGQAEISTTAGKQVLTKPGDMTRVTRASAAPSAVTMADPAYIDQTFREALAIEPSPPAKFTLYFETGTTTLQAQSEATIPEIVSAIGQREAISIAISGHTDATGSVEVNNKLALARAEQVRHLLLQQGVSADLISVSSHGKGNPAVPTPDGVAEPLNRRVEVTVQ